MRSETSLLSVEAKGYGKSLGKNPNFKIGVVIAADITVSGTNESSEFAPPTSTAVTQESRVAIPPALSTPNEKIREADTPSTVKARK